jgi:hypothetical protein
MRAKPGDRLVLKRHRTGQYETDGEILEVHGEHGEPPFWSDGPPTAARC